MTLKAVVDTLEGVPEAVHSFYGKGDDGKFRLNVEGLEDTSGLKTALQKERENAKAAEQYKKLGMTPDEILALKTEREKAEEERARKAGEFDKLTEKMRAQFDAELAKVKAEYEPIAKSEQEARITIGLTNALSDAGASPEGLKLLPAILADRAKIETIDGKRVVKILDADGSPMLVKGKDATFADLATVVASEYPSLFKATTKAGSGTQSASSGAGSAGKTIEASKLASMSPQEKAQFFRENPNIRVST